MSQHQLGSRPGNESPPVCLGACRCRALFTVSASSRQARGHVFGAGALGRCPPLRGWIDIFWRVYHNIPEHRVISIAAGVTFFVLLAIFPGIAALVAIYGLFADPSSIGQHLNDLSGVLPGGATEVIGDQLTRLTSQPRSQLGFALIFGVAVSLWSANAGMGSPDS